MARRLGREWPAGSRLPGVREMASQLNVSPATLMLALRELKQQGILDARPRAGTFITNRYTNNELRTLAERLQSDSRSTSTLDGCRVELAYVQGSEELVPRMVRAVKDDLIERGAVIAGYTHLSPDGFERVVPRHRDGQALIVFNPGSHRPLSCGSRQVMLVINTGAACRVETTGRYDVVTVDQEQGSRLAARHLRKIGCTRVCFLGVEGGADGEPSGNGFDVTSSARLSGFRTGWDNHPVVPMRTYAYRFTAGAKSVQPFLAQTPRPEAVFAASDELALGFLFGAIGAGLRVGRDFHLIGFDGQSLGQRLPESHLTTVAVPAEEMGRRGVQLLASRIGDADQPVRNLALGCDLIPGATAVAP
jgi:DNA-binding LacI/PurR family transcriptional regulator